MVAGATGLVGQSLVHQLLADARCTSVHSLVRKQATQNVASAKLVSHIVDFARLDNLPKVDTLLIALGTTLKVAGSQAAFRAVDFDAVLKLAKAAKLTGARAIGVVSAMGASSSSRVFYNRVKAETELAILALGFERTVIVRPSFLQGNRRSLDQPARPGEALALFAFGLLRPVIPANYRAVSARDVAAALIHHTSDCRGVGALTLQSGELALTQP